MKVEQNKATGKTILTVSEQERDIIKHSLFFASTQIVDDGSGTREDADDAARLAYVIENLIEEEKTPSS